ncbi:MAG: YfiR family protein [Bacteroidales bacterium]|nr:YfiR family protein [Bacteroidales bacterium]
MFILFFIISFQSFSQTNIYVLKAVYLEKFSRFITWPEESQINNVSEPFIISVIGRTPLTKNLEQIYSIQKINNKKVIIKRISNLYEIENSHILVIAESEKKNLQNILTLTKNLPVLTVSEASDFSEKGVIVNFFEENNKLRFEINETAVLESPLQMSFYLMNSAKIVHPVKDN